MVDIVPEGSSKLLLALVKFSRSNKSAANFGSIIIRIIHRMNFSFYKSDTENIWEISHRRIGSEQRRIT